MTATLATPDGTATYADDHAAADGYWRTVDLPGLGELTLPSLGMGSYLGGVDEEARRGYTASAEVCLAGGVNLLDTAINYRNQLSERDLGRALAAFLDDGGARDQVVVVTKGGFLHGDGETDPQAHVGEEYIRPGIIAPDDIVGGVHCMTPDYLDHELATSLANLGLDAVDVYMVHNPETQLGNGVDPETFRDRLRDAFAWAERQVDAGRVGCYGIATWEGLRLPSSAQSHLPLEQVLDLARAARDDVDGDPDGHHLGALELPVNLALTEAAVDPTQRWDGQDVPVLHAADDAGLMVLASASLMQARIVGHIKEEVRKVLAAEDDVAACIEFARSCRGVTTALVGMGSPEHAEVNLKTILDKPAVPERVEAMLGG